MSLKKVITPSKRESRHLISVSYLLRSLAKPEDIFDIEDERTEVDIIVSRMGHGATE